MKLSPIVVKFTVLGVVPSLKNQKELGRNIHTGRANLRDREQLTRYKGDFGLQVPAKYRGIGLGGPDDLLTCTVTIFHDSWKRDIDAEIVFDCLQVTGVVKNDRWIRVKHIYGERIDVAHPRCDITLSYL